jgi:hypothetical protein
MTVAAAIFLLIFLVYGAGWFWQVVSDALRESGRPEGEGAGPERLSSAAALRRRPGGVDPRELRETFIRFAEEREGQAHTRSPVESPRVTYPYKVARVVLSIHDSEEGEPGFVTQLAYSMPHAWRHRVEIRTVGRSSDPPLPWFRYFRTGDPAFDGRFAVLSDDSERTEELLTGPVRGAIDDLSGLLANDDIHVSIGGSRLIIRKRGIVAGAPELELFARLSDVLYDRALHLWQRQSGIEILDDAPPEAAADPLCQVCGHRIPGQARVQCRRCRTPHHSDCWSFNGGCATFACGEKAHLKSA